MSKKNLQELQEDSKSYFEQYPEEESFIATQDGLFFKQSNCREARDHALKTKSETFVINRSDVFEDKGIKLKSETPDETWTVAELKSYLDENAIEYTKSAKKEDLVNLALEFIKSQSNPAE